MTTKMYDRINKTFPLTEIDCGEFKEQKISGMKFNIRAFHAEGLGHASIMTASGFFGLMKMDTLIINPTERDMPLFSYDRVYAMGNDTLIFELYDTLLSKADLSRLGAAKITLDFPEHDLGEHWYDSIKLPESVSKKGKKKDSPAFDALALEYTDAYLSISGGASVCSREKKRERASLYVEGLLKNGGPSTDVFLKGIGRERTEQLFRNLLFGTEI